MKIFENMAISVKTLIDKYKNPDNYLSKSDKEICKEIEVYIDTEIEEEYASHYFEGDNTNGDGNFEVNLYPPDSGMNSISESTKNLIVIYLKKIYEDMGWSVDNENDRWDWYMTIDPVKYRDNTIENLLDEPK